MLLVSDLDRKVVRKEREEWTDGGKGGWVCEATVSTVRRLKRVAMVLLLALGTELLLLDDVVDACEVARRFDTRFPGREEIDTAD